MKNKILTFFTLGVFVFAGFVYGQSTSSADLEEAQTLKEKIASKVAELQKKDQRAIVGVITAISETTIKITNPEDVVYSVKLDKNLTKIYTIAAGNQREAQLSDLEKADYIIISGPIDNRTITANAVYKDEQFFVGSGTINEINSIDSYIKALTVEKETYALDIETSTKKLILNTKTLDIEATTLSQMKEGDTIHFIYKKTGSEREKNRYSAQKVLIIPQEYFIK